MKIDFEYNFNGLNLSVTATFYAYLGDEDVQIDDVSHEGHDFNWYGVNVDGVALNTLLEQKAWREK